MANPETTPGRDRSYGIAYFRILGREAGEALKPILMSAAKTVRGSDWDRVREGLESISPWLASAIERLAARLRGAPAEDSSRGGESGGEHT